jgi:phosphopantothenoylcysteine decarboxylase/phosphopantothenate--cysteine ligase
MFNGKTIVLGVTGGIASYKAIQLCSMLTQAGATVRVMMTTSATKFVTPLTFQTITRQAVSTDTFEENNPSVVNHIDLADSADLIVIAPATANMIAKMAQGIADDMVSTTLLAATCPIIVAPAMNVHMLGNPAVQDNLRILRQRGIHFVDPSEGQLACGYVGKGRLAEPSHIFDYINKFMNGPKPLAGQRVLITAGGTVERIDPVRYISNDSSGKMAFALAEAAKQLGAEVEVIAARTTVEAPGGVSVVRAMSADDMFEAVDKRFAQADIVIMAAAVADFKPKKQLANKFKKTEGQLEIELEPTKDILMHVGHTKTNQYVVGFAAETEQLAHYAQEKLARKKCDLIVANQVSLPGVGFEQDTNAVEIYNTNGLVQAIAIASKQEIATGIWQAIIEQRSARAGGSL